MMASIPIIAVFAGGAALAGACDPGYLEEIDAQNNRRYTDLVGRRGSEIVIENRMGDDRALKQ